MLLGVWKLASIRTRNASDVFVQLPKSNVHDWYRSTQPPRSELKVQIATRRFQWQVRSVSMTHVICLIHRPQEGPEWPKNQRGKLDPDPGCPGTFGITSLKHAPIKGKPCAGAP